MNFPDFSRSKALNNIPQRKLQDKLSQVENSEEKPEIKHLKAVAYNRYYESNIPLEYWDLKMPACASTIDVNQAKTLKNWTVHGKSTFGYAPGENNGVLNTLGLDLTYFYASFKEHIKEFYINGFSVCFAGKHGVGKTMTATACLKIACQKGYSCLYTNLSDVVNVLTQASGEEKFLARRELCIVDFLVIDEFDPRFMPNENAADLYARTLETVFRTRKQNKLPTIMCTNSPNVTASFTGALKESFDSLSKEMKIIYVLGEDHRSKKA